MRQKSLRTTGVEHSPALIFSQHCCHSQALENRLFLLLNRPACQ